MAVQDYFTNEATNVGTKREAGLGPSNWLTYTGRAEIAAADDDTSTYLLIPAVSAAFRPVRATIMTEAITGGTAFDIGVYNPRTGAVVDVDLFVNDQTLASASKVLDGLSNVATDDILALKTIYELLSLTATTALPAYDVVLTGATVGSAAGSVVYILEGIAG